MLKAALKVLKLSCDKTQKFCMQRTIPALASKKKKKNTNKPTNQKELVGLVGNLFRIGKKSEILICIYTDPVYWHLRKWIKSYKTAC